MVLSNPGNPPSSAGPACARMDTVSPRARIRRIAAATWAGVLLLLPGPVAADDVDPQVLPDRIDDVPATRPDPFPAFDNFSWRAFVALNWPALTDAAHRGEPDRSKALGDPGPRVWETFKSRYEVFQRDPDGRALVPSPWDSYEARNPCGSDVDNRTKTLRSFTPFADFNQAGFTIGGLANPLVAQNGTYTRFEVRFDREEFSSIVDHKWYIRRNLPTVRRPAAFNTGSIQIKAAWRILTDRDTAAVRQRYYVVKDALVVDVHNSLKAGTSVCSRQDIALVGLHIVVKTTYRPQWIWSSFEHVDNVPPIGKDEAREPDARGSGVPYSYNNPNKPQSELDPPVDSPALLPISADNPPKEHPDPMQVIRQQPINAETMAMNRAYWALPEVRRSVWANYMLVLTQWPTVTQPPGPDNDGLPFPGGSPRPHGPLDFYQLPHRIGEPNPNVANTTMETYRQTTSSNCMACHHLVSNALGRDFVAFMALDAGRP